MFPLLTGLISGGASLLGSMFSSDTSAANTQANIQGQEAMQQQTQQFNAQQAQMNRDFQSGQVQQQEAFQTQMSNSAYQRASQDMQKAGLNPAMMFGSGGPASVPSGGAASGSTASVGTPNMGLSQRTSPFAGLGDAVNKTINSAIAAKTYDKMTDEIANIQADTAKRSAEAATERERPQQVVAQTQLTDAESAKLGNLMPAFRWAGMTAKDLENMPDWMRKAGVVGGWAGEKAGDAIAPFVHGARSFNQLWRDRTGYGY